IAAEDFAAGAPDLLALADVGDVDHHLDDIGHAAAGGFDEVADPGKDQLRLRVLVAIDDAPLAAARDHAGDVGNAVDEEAIRPGAGRRLGHLGAHDALDARSCVSWHLAPPQFGTLRSRKARDSNVNSGDGQTLVARRLSASRAAARERL